MTYRELSAMSEQGGEGLYDKYEVTKDGEPVLGCFILEPKGDEAAREAIRAYADATDNDKLARDLTEWMDQLEADDAE